MPGANCSVYGCRTSRYTTGISIFSVPRGDDEYSTNWRANIEHIITKDRVVNKAFREQILKRRIHVCELHFEKVKLVRRK